MNKANHKETNRIIKQCLQHDRKAQRALYDLLFTLLKSTLLQFRLTIEEIEDLLQESFIEIFNRLDTYDQHKASLQTWSCTIAKRKAINYSKTQAKRHLEASLNECHIDLAKIAVPDTSSLHLEQVISQMANLHPKYREVLDLSIFQGLKHEAIGQMLGISTSSSRVYLARAIKQLKLNVKNVAQ